jgi:glucan 1,3-beta-glucosidase
MLPEVLIPLETLRQSFEAAASRPDGYWLNDLSGNGYAAFNPNPGSYKVFRNVRDYGAVGK